MHSDPVARVLLAFIAICLLLLLAQGAGMMGAAATVAPALGEGRYNVQVQLMKTGSLLVKTDTTTGEVWRKSLSGDGPWVYVDEESRPAEDESGS